VVRFAARKGSNAIYSLAISLAAPFFIARNLIGRFDFSPEYSIGFGYRITDETEPAGTLPNPMWEDWFTANVEGRFSEGAGEKVLRCLQGGNQGRDLTRDGIRQTLDGVWARCFPGA
jgi:hypothetical protein